jgi:hypothetical protein
MHPPSPYPAWCGVLFGGASLAENVIASTSRLIHVGVSAQIQKIRPSIITCPVCGSGMRPRTVVPEEYHRQRMTFVCECGFDYCQSSAVAIERTL